MGGRWYGGRSYRLESFRVASPPLAHGLEAEIPKRRYVAALQPDL